MLASTPLLLTSTFTSPAPRSGVLQTTRLVLKNVPATALAIPNRQLSALDCTKWRPDTVTTCPCPPCTLDDGLTPSTVALSSYRNSNPVDVSAPALSAKTSATLPTASVAGDTQVIRLEVRNCTPPSSTGMSPNRHARFA